MNWKKIFINKFYYSSNKIGHDTSIFSMIGMGVGCFAMIIALSVLNGFESIVQNRLRGFESDLNMRGIVSDVKFFAIPEIEMIMPYMERKAIIKINKDILIVTIKAIADSLIDGFYDIPYKGNFPSNGQVMIGKTLASRLGKDIDDDLTLLSPIDQVFGLGFTPMKKMKISGIFSTKILNYDDSHLFITLDDGETLFKRKIGIDGYDIKLYDSKIAESAKKKLYNLFGQSVIIKSWKDKNKSLVDAMEMERKASIIILGLIFLVASFNLSSSLILLSIKKLKEVGMIRVLGARRKEVINIMIFLGVKTAMKGALIGLGVGLSIVFLQNNYPFIPLPSEVYFINYLPMKLDLIDFIIVIIMVSSFIIFSSYFAAIKVASKNLKEAIEWVK